MTINTEVELLRRVPLFRGIETSRLKLLAFTSERLVFPPGTTLFSEGEHGDCAYIILGGNVDVCVLSSGSQIKLATLGPNSIVGEMALLADMPRSATVVATGPIDALRIRKEQFFQIMRDIPQVTLEIMRELAIRLNNANRDLSLAHARLRAAGLE